MVPSDSFELKPRRSTSEITSLSSSSSFFTSQKECNNDKEKITDNERITEKVVQWWLVQWKKSEGRFPFLQKVSAQLRRIPPTWRVTFVMIWILWKIIMTIVAIRFLYWSATTTTRPDGILKSILASQKQQQQQQQQQQHEFPQFNSGSDSNDHQKHNTKVLYIVTSLAEYDNGHRSTVKGRDRFKELMVPCIVDSIDNMLTHPYDFDVDLYLITAFTLKPERRSYIEDQLPQGVGFQVWDDACPLGYDKREHKDLLGDVTRALARQHRYVIKDKLHNYDIFLPFEDDMLVKGAHVQQYLDMTAELERLTNEAPETMPDVPETESPTTKMKYFGQMTRHQMKRLIPGFIRVEVLLNETEHGAQSQLAPIDLDYDFEIYANGKYHPSSHHDDDKAEIDPSFCCHIPNLQNIAAAGKTPLRPTASDVIIWETRAEALSLRHVAHSKLFQWLILLPGPGKREKLDEKVFGYWSGRNGAYGQVDKKPSGGVPDLIAQQGGWMATRGQLMRLDEELCSGNFLPPYNEPLYYEDGQQSMNVEFWSGGYQFFTGVRGGCNMQRVISFASPSDFSKHLLYHMANNKQKQLPQKRMLRAQDLLGQMNTVLKQAQKDMISEG